MIEVKDLVKRFGSHTVLDRVSFHAADGSCTAVSGANGVGKSTLLRILAGGLSFNSGTVIINGYSFADHPLDARKECGYVGHQPLLYGDLTAEENLRLYYGLYNVKGNGGIIAGLLKLVGLETQHSAFVKTFSRGMMQRLAIARALLHNPKVLLLDEPSASLDQEAELLLQRILLQLKKDGRTIIMATHDAAGIGSLADRVVVIEKGMLLDKKATGGR